MKSYTTISPKKQALLDAVKNSPPQVGEEVYINGSKDLFTIKSIAEDKVVVISQRKQEKIISLKDITRQFSLYTTGEDPFDVSNNVRFVAFSLQSVLFGLDMLGEEKSKYTSGNIIVPEANFNPYVIDKNGKKQYYQRGLVWSLEDKQNLINSIYLGIDCGKILIRKRSFEWIDQRTALGDSEVAFKDVVDGKQRLNAIADFIKGLYPDAYGNYYSDLSAKAQYKLVNHQLFSYAEMDEETTDEQVLYQFLKLNFAGVPQSREHIEFVREIAKTIK